ncbi:MAG: NifU family protein [Acidimicrobiales bacterium]
MDAAVPVLSLTDKAVTKVLDIRGAEPDPESLALWIEINGTNGDAYRYDMYFQAAADAGADDWTRDQSGLMTVVPARSVGMIVGSVLDVDGDEPDDGMSIRNPNHPPSGPASPTIAGSVDLSGDLAQRVSQVLDQQVNPSIAAHGGRADLVAVEEKDGVAYLRLSGGCAGCGMAAVTLGQGIEVAIKDSVPEIIRIVDVTDHAAGTNPYYEPAKK